LNLSDCHYGPVSAKKPREIAAQVLQNHAAGAGRLEDLLEDALARGGGLGTPDRALARELAFGVVRWQATLDWLIASRTDGRPQKPMLQILLRLGLYQLFWLDRVPDHAAVHETVELAKQLGFGPRAGFVNALLRGCGREREALRLRMETLKAREPHLGYSHPEWLCARWMARWGEERLTELLEWNNTPPRTFARVNTLRATPEQLAAQFDRESVLFTPRLYDWVAGDLVFELREHPPIASLPSFQQGLFYIQDPSTLLAVSLWDPQPGERLLDLCSAPGGKTTYAAQLMKNQGTVVAHDTDERRLELVRENAARLGVTCVEFLPCLVPASVPSFDRLLVDAPCSNTGVMRRRVELRWRVQPPEIDRLRLLQLDLLRRSAGWLKSGGVLVYSTCSIEPSENEEVVRQFVSETPGFHLEIERQLLPFADGVDGAYVAKLRKS
jgi:16S rRNA (cytosine967-C5)-methyltransferase